MHSRGSGTEALMRLMADIHGIEYSNISYIPGSEVRAGALLQGTINASIVDGAAWRLLQEEGEVETDAVQYYSEAVEGAVYPLDGGSPEDARDDFEFLAAAPAKAGRLHNP